MEKSIACNKGFTSTCAFIVGNPLRGSFFRELVTAATMFPPELPPDENMNRDSMQENMFCLGYNYESK